MFFFAPFIWVMVVPALFLSVVLIRALFWVRSLTRPTRREHRPEERNFIEGEFVDEEDKDVPQDQEGSPPPRNPLEK